MARIAQFERARHSNPNEEVCEENRNIIFEDRPSPAIAKEQMVLEKSLNNDSEAIQDTQAKLAELSTMLGFFAEKLFE